MLVNIEALYPHMSSSDMSDLDFNRQPDSGTLRSAVALKLAGVDKGSKLQETIRAILGLELCADGRINLDVSHPNLKIAHSAPCHGIDPQDAHPHFDYDFIGDRVFDDFPLLNSYTSSKHKK